ncbi:glycosyltransferase [Flavobacteriales bacterium]|nr:glycosyltransferase [Flavobacteriales bacterium]
MISIIIPIFNEEEGVKNLLKKLKEFNTVQSKLNLEFIFVNDGSSDNSLVELKKESVGLNSKIISFSKNFGSHAALRAGISNASNNLVTFMYADLQDPLQLIVDLYEEQKKGYDIVWANRKADKTRLLEGLFSRVYAKIMRKYALSDFPKKGFDIVFFNEKIKVILNRNQISNSSIFLQILSFGFKQTSIEYIKKERKIGKSKWTISKKIKLFIDSFVSFSYAPLKFVTLMGGFLFSVGFLYSIYLIVRKIIFNDLDNGWPALISIILIGFGITNISLGIIAEYLWRTFDAARKSEVFIIDEIIENK